MSHSDVIHELRSQLSNKDNRIHELEQEISFEIKTNKEKSEAQSERVLFYCYCFAI
jgi:hypothetical protein